MTTEANKPASGVTTPDTAAAAAGKAPKAPKAPKAKAEKPKAEKPAAKRSPGRPKSTAEPVDRIVPEAEVNGVLPKNREQTKRGPGRPRKPRKPGHNYRVTYMPGSKFQDREKTRIVFAQDESTAICEAHRLNGISNTHHHTARAARIDEQGEELDPTYADPIDDGSDAVTFAPDSEYFEDVEAPPRQA